MASYELKNLSGYDFELLTKDLLEKELKLPLESFSVGKDQGIDIRYSSAKKNQIVIQCKHYIGSKLSDLLTAATRELPKVKLLQPERYILVTSLGLLPDAKDKIKEVFSPCIQSTQDIIGYEALNDLIAKHKDVERKHYKLWMTSTEVLKYILHSAVYNKSKIVQAAMLRKAQIYVQNRTFDEALKILGKNHYCIVSGVPGIGKTTLAEVLALKYQTRGYELITVSLNIDDAYRVLDEDKKQLFIFDDFLGSTFLEDRLKDNSVVRFIEHVAKAKNKRFILTTREYILKQAIEQSEGYARAQLKKCIVKQEHYTRKVKAHILYNHLYFSNLASDYKTALTVEQNYLKIVDHKTFSPRIIEWMTNELNVRNIQPAKYSDQFLDALDNPKVIWKIAFERHLSPMARSVVLLLGFLYDSVDINDFAVLLRSWKNDGINDQVEWNIAFKSSLKELDGTFVKFDGSDGSTLKFHNPSISDFISEYAAQSPEILDSFLFTELKFWDQFGRAIQVLPNTNAEKVAKITTHISLTMIRNIFLPTLELERNYSNSTRKKTKSTFARLRLVLDLVKGIASSESESVKNDILRLAIQEAHEPFEANYDVYFVFSTLLDHFGTEALIEVYELIRVRILQCTNYVELTELSDIHRLLSNYDGEEDNLALQRFEELSNQYELEDSLYELRKTEEAISGFILNSDMLHSPLLDEVRDKISELERAESEADSDDDEYSESVWESRQTEQRENKEIDDMFGTL